MNTNILTRPNYWTSAPESVKSMWQALANRTAANARTSGVVICTHRPDLREHRGSKTVRRCSTGGKWGKSSDMVSMSIESLLAAGYVWRTYTPASVRLADKREMVYSNDTH
jgi:hypothetical protein